jgi:hypothetical protein
MNPMNPAKPKTAALPDNSVHLRRLVNNTRDKGTDELPSHKPELVLSVRGMTEHYQFNDKLSITVGRSDQENIINVDVDLTPYGAHERGVSRVHLLMQLFPGNRIYVMDMGSSNGTHLSGERLTPFKFYLIHDYDYLVLGRLPVQVHFQ